MPIPYPETLAIAREDWCWLDPDTGLRGTFCGDDLIALAVGCIGQSRYGSAPLTAEDAAILTRQTGATLIDGAWSFFDNNPNVLRAVCALNL